MRVQSSDPDEAMPPAATGKKLSPREIELLTIWIRQGAKFDSHWSYVKPVARSLPRWSIRPGRAAAIDRFLLARLERDGLKPSPEADRYTLVRRLSLDLTGLRRRSRK